VKEPYHLNHRQDGKVKEYKGERGMFKSVLRFVGLCLFLIFIGGNVWADTLSSSDPCYGKYYTGPGGGSISCNYENTFGKCFQVSANKCEFWCKQPNYFRLVDSTSITSSSQITSNMGWACQGGTNLTGSCGTQKTSYDGQTYYQNESYLDCRKTIGIGSDAPALAGQSSAYVRFKINPDFTSTNSSYGFDVKAGKTWNPYDLTDKYPSWVFDSRGYRCGAGTRINSSAQLCAYDSGRVGRISGSSCSTSSSVISAQPYCTACANGTYNSSYTTSTSCTAVPANSTASSDKTTFVCNANYIHASYGCLRCPYGGATSRIHAEDYSIDNDSYFIMIAEGIEVNNGNWSLASPGTSSNETSCSIEYTGSDTTGTYSTGSCTMTDTYPLGYDYYIGVAWTGYQGAISDCSNWFALVCSGMESTSPRNQGEGECADGMHGTSGFDQSLQNLFGCSLYSDGMYTNSDPCGAMVVCPSAYSAQLLLTSLVPGAKIMSFSAD